MIIKTYNFYDILHELQENDSIDELQTYINDIARTFVTLSDRTELRVVICTAEDDILFDLQDKKIYGLAIYVKNCWLRGLYTEVANELCETTAMLMGLVNTVNIRQGETLAIATYEGTNIDVYKTIINKPVMYLSQIWVNSENRGEGLFKLLFEEVLKGKTTECFMITETLFGSYNSAVPPGFLYSLYIDKYNFIKIGYSLNEPDKLINEENTPNMDMLEEVFNLLIRNI